MKQQIIAAALSAVMLLTGCGDKKDMTVQKDDVPVIPAVTSAVPQTDGAAAVITSLTAVRTNACSTETAAKTSLTTAVTEPKSTSAGGTGNSGSGQTSGTVNTLYGKWETVSFSKDSGGSVSYDLSDPVHKSYYVGLDLNGSGQSELTVGTETHPASAVISGSSVEVCTVNRDNPVRMVFAVNADKSRLTVSLLNGRITAVLKRIGSDFSIKAFLPAESPSESPYSAADLTGEWSMPGTFGTRNNSMTVRSDGTVIMRYAAGGTRSGKLRIDKEEHPDGTAGYWYSVYDDDNTAWIGFPCGDLPVSRIASGQDGETEFVRISLADLAAEKMNNLTFLMQSMSGGGGDLETDPDRTMTVDNRTYTLVTDERFMISSLGKAAFERLLEETLSGNEYTEWKAMLEDSFLVSEPDGQTYVLTSEAHGYQTFETGSGVTVTEQTETSFTAATVDGNQLDGRGTAHFVFDGKNWTIESFEFR